MKRDRGKGAFGFLLVVLGVLFLLVNSRLVPFGWGATWPVFPFLAGVVFFRLFAGRRRPADLVAAVLLTQAGVFFLVFSTGVLAWPALHSLWPFFILFPGIAFLSVAGTGNRPESALFVGLVVVAVSMVGFWVAGGDEGARALDPILRFWPVSLVVAGGMIVFRAARAGKRPQGSTAEGPLSAGQANTLVDIRTPPPARSEVR
jgi:hypothetical protein